MEHRLIMKQADSAFAGSGMPPRQSSRTSAAALGTIILLQLPLAGWLSPGSSLAAQLGREAVYWTLTAMLLGYVLLWERRPLASVGWRRPGWKTLAFGLAGAAAMVCGMAVIYLVVYPALGLSSDEGALTAVRALPSWFRVLLILRAAVFEEIFYRGFMIERLAGIARARWLAAAVSCFAFTLAHVDYWGWAHLLVAGFGGVILTALYLVRRDLGCNMVAHLATDAIGLLAG
jgi:membrane protease YdiL (CAAX protease family)